ncbi:MAG TPA: hypothetical protein P5055_15585 [Candidatus Paceibacterota bacterium]|nr:hypothetical protein [Candidatus Paceibacterota bacterium]
MRTAIAIIMLGRASFAQLSPFSVTTDGMPIVFDQQLNRDSSPEFSRVQIYGDEVVAGPYQAGWMDIENIAASNGVTMVAIPPMSSRAVLWAAPFINPYSQITVYVTIADSEYNNTNRPFSLVLGSEYDWSTNNQCVFDFPYEWSPGVYSNSLTWHGYYAPYISVECDNRDSSPLPVVALDEMLIFNGETLIYSNDFSTVSEYFPGGLVARQIRKRVSGYDAESVVTRGDLAAAGNVTVSMYSGFNLPEYVSNAIVALGFINIGGGGQLHTSTNDLPSGSLYNNDGVLSVVP